MLELNSISVKRGNRLLVEDLSLKLHAGSLVPIIGSNGVGKTSMLQCIVGLSKPFAGSVAWNGKKCEGPNTNLQRMAYQSAKRRMSPLMQVNQFLQDGHAKKSLPKRWVEIIELLELTDFLKRPLGSLSDGELKRCELGRVLLSKADVLILDEPDTFLDIAWRHLLYRQLQSERGNGRVILFSSQNVSEILRLGCQCLFLDGLGGWWMQDPNEIVELSAFKESYLRGMNMDPKNFLLK